MAQIGFQSQTLNMAASTGYVVSLAAAATKVFVTTRGECFVQPLGGGATPATPVSTDAIPGSGLTTKFTHLLYGEIADFGTDPDFATGGQPQGWDQIQYVRVWCVGAGYLVIYAH